MNYPENSSYLKSLDLIFMQRTKENNLYICVTLRCVINMQSYSVDTQPHPRH